jgi:hypothetical protein
MPKRPQGQKRPADMMQKTTFLALAAIGFLASPMMARAASADSAKSCGAAWTVMAPADKAKTTHREFLTTCKGAQETAARPARKPAAVNIGGCHDYSDCPAQSMVPGIDPK